MTIQTIKEVIINVLEGDCSIAEGAKALNMPVIDFERLLNAWEDAQQAWGRMLRIAIISELKHGKTDEEIIETLGCSEEELERDKRRLARILGAIDEVQEGSKTLACGSCIARVYISEFSRMMDEERKNGKS